METQYDNTIGEYKTDVFRKRNSDECAILVFTDSKQNAY